MTVMHLLHRMVLVKVGAVSLSGDRPLDTDGFFEGHIVAVDPETDKDGKVVDHMLRIKLRAGPSKRSQTVSISANNKNWKLRFPKKGE